MTIGNITLKLQKYLSSRVHGKVYVLMYRNKVYVSIENSENDLWRSELPILQANISEVKMVRILAQLILTQYGKDIFNKYFNK